MTTSTLASIGHFLKTVESAEKRANVEPGSVGGETAHPVKDVDDRTDPADEGSRSAENEADVKEDQGAPGVDSASDAKAGGDAVSTPGSAADDQLQIGTNKQPTGEDPSVETSSAKAGRKDPGTLSGSSTHPARIDNDELDGHKYAVDRLAKLPLEQVSKLAADLGDKLLKSCIAASSAPQTKQAAVKPGDSDAEAAAAHQAGWELAGFLAQDKQAADALVRETLEEMIADSVLAADRVASYLHAEKQAAAKANQKGRTKRAMGDMPPDAGPGGGDDAEMLSAMDDVEDGGESAAPAGEGGDAFGAGAGGGGEAEMQQLMQLLEQLGITPEELMQMLQAEAGGGDPAGGMGGAPGAPGAPGGPPGMGGGDMLPPEMMPPGGGGGSPMEVAAGDRRGKPKASKQAAAGNMHDYLVELVSRSRRAG